MGAGETHLSGMKMSQEDAGLEIETGKFTVENDEPSASLTVPAAGGAA